MHTPRRAPCWPTRWRNTSSGRSGRAGSSCSGPHENDKLFAEALKRSAKRFGAKIVEERTFTYDPGSRRTDGGFEQMQQQIPTFTQSAPDYDVMLVADEGNLFGDYLPYRTWDARPVAGTAGPRAHELASGHRAVGRHAIPEPLQAARRPHHAPGSTTMPGWRRASSARPPRARKSAEYEDLVAYMKSPNFEFAGFKGVGLSVRDWNGQLRQPILVATPKLLVTVSPQQGFLHQFSELDTLGIDKPETKCKAYTQ